MSQVEMYRRELARHREKEASLRKELNRHQEAESRAIGEVHKHSEAAARTKADSIHRSYIAAAERARKKAVDGGKKVTAVSEKLARNAKDQATTTSRLLAVERADQQAADRDASRRRRKELDHAREVSRLSSTPVFRFVHIRQPEPEKLRVLYLTANPELNLMTESELRQVQQALRSSKHRDRVEIMHRPAATFQDLLDGLNDVRPHIVHFSGHSGGSTVQFDHGGITPGAGHTVNYSLLVEALAATDQPPELLVLNSCDSLDGVSTILPAVPVVIGMSDVVSDTAAIVFAQQFYAAICSGQSVGAALKQGRVKILAVSLDPGESDLPQLISRDDVDIDSLVLVQPAA